MRRERRPFHAAVAEFKRRFLQHMLDAHAGNHSHTALTLRMQRSYLLRLIREYLK
jgi:DNA-binding NtrC family response regulator